MARRRSMLAEAALAPVAGVAATHLMSLVTTAMAERQSAADRVREKAVSPGIAYEVAARRGARTAGAELTEEQIGLAGSILHYALGGGWALAYVLLRRVLGWHPLPAGLATGLSLEVIVDQGANSALGLSAPPLRYPASTHVRGLVGHLVYGLGVAAALELVARRPRP